jgi:hypothetical protein
LQWSTSLKNCIFNIKSVVFKRFSDKSKLSVSPYCSKKGLITRYCNYPLLMKVWNVSGVIPENSGPA